MVQLAEVDVRGFYSQAYEPIPKNNAANSLKGFMAHAQVLDRNETAVSSVSFNMDKSPEVTAHRDKQCGMDQTMFALVERFKELTPSAASYASLAGQSPSLAPSNSR